MKRCSRAVWLMIALAGGALGSQWNIARAQIETAPAGTVMAPIDAPQAAPAPDPAPPVMQAIAALYLTEDERRALRVFHGLWHDGDLSTPALRARAALVAGALDDASLHDMNADGEDRAEAALERGELEQALEIAAPLMSMRAARIRAAALEEMGRFAEADQAVQPVVDQMMDSLLTTAADLTEAAKALRIRARIQGRPASDFTNLMKMLTQAQQELDRLHWPALLEQADLLYDKDNSREAVGAVLEVLALNPNSAKAWDILGRVSVDAFDFGKSEAVALRLELLERAVRGVESEEPIVSAYANSIRARAALRQNDPELASSTLRSALERYAMHRECLALGAAAVALTYDWDALEDSLLGFDALSPGSPQALFEAGRALSENRQYDKAAEYLERAQERQPNWPAPVIELGLLEMQSGRDMQALTALRRATALDEFNVRARNSRILIEELVTYDAVETEHFTIRYKPGVDEILAREMAGPLEEIYTIVTQGVEHEPDRKTVIELLPNHEWFAVRITGMTGIHTIAAATGPVIALEAPREGKKHFGVYDWVRVLRHEYVHTVTLSRTNYRIPLWFTEAAAVFLENVPRDYSTCQLLVGALTNDALFDMEEVNIAFVRPKRRTDRAQGYAQGHWMYEFIRERWGPQAPLDMMDHYAAGVREDAAMRQTLGMSQAEFLSAFREWARDDARSWGMLPDQSFVELLREESFADPVWQAQTEALLEKFALESGLAGNPAQALLQLKIPLLSPSMSVMDRMLERSPGHPDVLEIKINTLVGRNGGQATPSMIPDLEAYAKARPVDPMPHRHLARLYLNSANPQAAIEHLEYLDVREQHSPAYAVELSKRYAALGDWDRAWAKAIRATQIAPYNASHRELAAGMAIQRGDLEEAERLIQTLTVLEPRQEIHQTRLERIRAMRAEAPGS